MLSQQFTYIALRLNVQDLYESRISNCLPNSRFRAKDLNIVFICALLILFINTAVAANGVLKLSTGAEYITGTFGGTESVDQLYVPITMSYTDTSYSLRLTVPYLFLSAPTGTISSDGTIIPGTGEIVTESGVGDVIASATYRDALKTEAVSDMAIDFTAKIKFGTADEDKGLGSGEDDYTLQAELYRFLDRSMFFGILGYKFRGDPPGINLSNSWIAFMGGNYTLSPEYKTGMDFYYQEALYSGAEDQMELSAFLRYKISSTRYLRGYLIKGLSDASPDWGVGIYIAFMQ